MQLLHLLPQLGTLHAGLLTAAPDERWLTHLEHTLSATLGGLETYRLVAASPTQLQEYFFLLEAFSHPIGVALPVAQRRLRACQALLLLESMASEREKTSAYSHEYSWLLPAAAGYEGNLPTAES